MPEMLVKVKIPAFTRTLVIVASVLQAISFSTRFIVYFTDYKSIRKLGFLIDMLYIKNVDAKWTKKNNAVFYGYKNHVKSDAKTKLIEKFDVTDASVHDSQAMEGLLEEKDEGQEIYADSAYTGEEQEKTYKKKKVVSMVNEKGCRNKPLTEEQKASNKEKSKIRARVEHIFGFVENSMNGSFVRTIGMARAKAKIGMMNLTYNICRCAQLRISVCMG